MINPAKKSNAAAVAKCRKNRKRVELLFQRDEYAALKAKAEAAGLPVAGYIKRIVSHETKEIARG